MLFKRKLKIPIARVLASGKSAMLLGPRQTGKTTIAEQMEYDRYVNLMGLESYYRYAENSSILAKEIRLLRKELGRKPLIVIDEIQKVPELTNDVQVLIDEGVAVFFLIASSTRKIENLLPGRVLLFRLSTMLYEELTDSLSLESVLMNGCLPGICQQTDQSMIEQELLSYITLYLEEEVRKEALVRNLGGFVNFLKLVCIESGNIVNFSAISQEVGVSQKTIMEYYRILEDCLLVRKIEPLARSSRRKLTKSARYLMFDLGLRRAGAREGVSSSKEVLGRLLEQYVGLELVTKIEASNSLASIYFWRDHDGPEVDYVLEQDGKYTPIGVKLTKKPTAKDIRHLKTFREEYPIKDYCYLVSNVPYCYEIEEGIMVLPWFEVGGLI